MKEQKEKVKTSKKKSGVAVSENGKAYINATFNNTLIILTTVKGDTVSWSSSGAMGFKGTRKSTPYAATLAAENAGKKAFEKGLRTVEVYVKGPGPGRDSALRGVRNAGLSISLIADITPIPHNGPRAKNKRRV
ncbi:30S ribosomal protein S11 [Patescibacteria group bacterium]|nr:30S ribosomal protein S11 [Patescibacteria group bacterium]